MNSWWDGTVPRLFVPAAQYGARPVTEVLVLEYGRLPSTDYYILPRLQFDPARRVRVVDMRSSDPQSLVVVPGTFVVIVRYITSRWCRRIEDAKELLAGVCYFMDDDLPGSLWSRGLPFRFRLKLLKLFHRQQTRLARICGHVWVSTAQLAEKYRIDLGSVIEPLPPIETNNNALLTYFYHGSASHQAEFRWLREVVASVQSRVSDLAFCVIGDGSIKRLFRGMRNVFCMHPMEWPDYLCLASTFRHDIGLAPLIGRGFNAGRAHTKFFDVTRLGATGVYSDRLPYAGFIRDGVDGVLLPNDAQIWSDEIISLAADSQRRARIVTAARARVELLRGASERLPYPVSGDTD